MAPIDDLEAIRALLAEETPSQGVNDYVKGRLTAVIAAAESHPGAPGSQHARRRRAVGGVARRRRLVLGLAAGAAAGLTAAAVALAASGVPAARHNSIGGSAIDAAYVVQRVDSALRAAEPGDIAQMTVTTRDETASGTTTTSTEEWSHDGQWRSLTHSSDGQPLYDEGVSPSSVHTVVSYQTRTWARQPQSGTKATPIPGSSGCVPAFAVVPLPIVPGGPDIGIYARSRPSTVATALRAAISCGTLAMADRQRVDGIDAIELTSSPDALASVTIWINPDTYLPVRVVSDPPAGQSGLWQTADIIWVPPTAQNLARLTVPVPAGFRQVPLPQLVRPGLVPIGQPTSK